MPHPLMGAQANRALAPPIAKKHKTLGACSSASSGKKPSHKMEQLYLDFGQKSFGRQVHCARCRMMYTEGQPDDEAAHRAHHERTVRGALMRECDSERVVRRAYALHPFLHPHPGAASQFNRFMPLRSHVHPTVPVWWSSTDLQPSRSSGGCARRLS